LLKHFFLFCKEIADIDREWDLKYMMVVASQLEAPMLHISLMVVAHIECNRRPHVEDAFAREYLPK